MVKKFPIWVLAALILFIGVVNAAADYWHLYFHVWWLDIPMHLLGGVWLSLCFLTLIRDNQKLPFVTMPQRQFVAVMFVSVLIIAIGWEAFEWGTDRMNGLIHFDLIDTLSDIMNGLLGAAAGSAFFFIRGYNAKI